MITFGRLILVLLVAATSLFAASGVAAASTSKAERCAPYATGGHSIGLARKPARQGSALRVSITQWTGPGAARGVPGACLTHWKVSDPASARFISNGQALLVRKQAVPGRVVTLSVRVRGVAKPVETSFKVAARDEVSLVGFYTQTSSQGCLSATGREAPKVGELAFDDAGRFSVTWQPFESYEDYWGGYQFDPGSGRIVLKVEGGNQVPASGRWEGRLELTAAGGLVFEQLAFGAPNDGPFPGPCRTEFRRQD